MTPMKLSLAVLMFAAIPTLSFAFCSYGTHQEANISCAEGMVWDAESKSCVPSTS